MTLRRKSLAKRTVINVFVLVVFCVISSGNWAVADDPEWEQISKNDSLTIFARTHPGVAVKEIRAVGSIDAPNWVVRKVVDGVEDYPSFMPYTTKTQVIERKDHRVVSYFRLDPPFIGPRDVTVAVSSHAEKREDGTVVYQLHWAPVDGIGPPPSPDITRIRLDEGSWKLEPADGGNKTIATYTILTDGGGGLPPFIINFANRQGVESLFAAVRKQAALPKYFQNREEASENTVNEYEKISNRHYSR